MKLIIALYLGAAIGGNLAVASYGPEAAVPVALLAIGFDLTSRDALHDAWNGKGLLWKMALLILSGSAISYLINSNSLTVGIASCCAFLVSAVSDATVYSLLLKRTKWLKVTGSNVAGSLADSLIFPTIAFHAFLPEVVSGQFLAKVAGGAIWCAILSRTLWRSK